VHTSPPSPDGWRSSTFRTRWPLARTTASRSKQPEKPATTYKPPLLGHVAFIPATDHSFSASLDYLQGVAQHVEKHPHNGVASWLHAIESEMHPNADSPTAALTTIDRAREALVRSSRT
jgi:hypothetical protein